MPKVRCVTLRWKDLRDCHTFLFILDLFVSMWRDVCPQLHCVYPYLLMNLAKAWNLWCCVARSSKIQNPVGQLWTVTRISTRTFVIIINRHACHRCIYILVTVILPVGASTITFFIKMYLLSPFLILFLWLWKFCN